MNDPVEDDRDIKIAGHEKKRQDNGEREAEELRLQHENGNLGKARQLGRQLSQMLRDVDGEAFFGRDATEDTELRTQRRLLFAFTCCYCVEKFIRLRVLQDVTLNAFYNALKTGVPDLYRSLDSAGAFSFYYLCVRREGKTRPAKAIGQYFAMLAGKRGQEVIERLGEALFIRFCDVMQTAIQSAGFKQGRPAR